MTNKDIGFKTYTWTDKDGKVSQVLQSALQDNIEAQQVFCINPSYIRFKPPSPPKRWTLKDYWKEAKDRIYLAVQCLKHGRDYLD